MFTIGEMLRVLIFQASIFLLFNNLIFENTMCFGLLLQLLFVLAQRPDFFLDGLVIDVDILYVCETTLGCVQTMSVLVIDINISCHFNILIWRSYLFHLLLVRFASPGIVLIFTALELIVEGDMIGSSLISNCVDYFIDLVLVDVQVGFIE